MDIVSFVILHYKDLKTTDCCVQSILKMDQQDRIRIVIVDNDIRETSERRQKIVQKYQDNLRITVLPVSENGGFSYANNLGYAYAREEQHASFIVVGNNDLVFTQSDFVKRLEKSYRESPSHVMGPDVIRQSTGEHQNPMDIRLRTKEEAAYTIRMNRMALKHYALLYPILYWNHKREENKQLKKRIRNSSYFEEAHESIVPFGACLIFTPDFVNAEEKAFVPETNFYYEEYILTRRCQIKGYRIHYDPDLKVLHESGMATRQSMKSEKERLRFLMERTAEACEVYSDWLKNTEVPAP